MQPYDEALVNHGIAAVWDTYAEAGRALDPYFGVWPSRMVYDYCAGMPWPQSEHKHLVGLRRELGLPIPEPEPVLAPALALAGTLFWDQRAGCYWKWRGVDAFRLYEAYLVHNDVTMESYLSWARAQGILLIRVFGMYAGALGRLVPNEWGQWYWTAMPLFFDRCARMGFAVEFTIGADAQQSPLSAIDFRAHQARVRGIAAAFPNVVVEDWNEPFQNAPGGNEGAAALAVADPAVVQAIGIYDNADMGSYDYSYLDYITDHTPRDAEWVRKGKRLWETAQALHVPCVGDEPFGIGRVVPGGSSSRSLVASDHAQYHGVCALFGAGSTIHGDFGIACRVPDAEEQACVDAVTQTWREVPADAPLWTYTRPGVGDCPLTDQGALRTYVMVNGGRAVGMQVRPVRAPVAAPGWRIISQTGYQGCVITLERG